LLVSIGNVNSQDLHKQKFQLAQSFENDGNIENAQNLYFELYKSNPVVKIYFDGYVRTTLLKGEYSKLLEFVQSHQKSHPQDDVSILIGELYWRTGDTKKADAIWTDFLDRINDESKIIELSTTQSKLRLFDKSIITLKKGRKKVNNDLVFSDELSNLYIITGDYKSGFDEIIKTYLNVTKQSNIQMSNNEQMAEGTIAAIMNLPGASLFIEERLKELSDNINPRILRLYAWFLRTTNKFEQALNEYIRLDDIYAVKGGEVHEFALGCMNDGYYDVAIKGFKWIIQKGKDSHYSISALYNLARALELKHNESITISDEMAEDIIRNYRNVIIDYPDSPTSDDCRFSIATIYYKIGKFDQALKELNLLLKKYQNLATAAKANLLKADIYLIMDDIEQAKKEYDNTKKLFKRFSREYFKAKYSLAEIEFYNGSIDSAIAHFTDLIAISSSDVSNDALEKVNIIEQNKNLNKALATYAQAELRSKQRKYQDAVKLYMDANELLPAGDLSDKSLLLATEIEVRLKNFEKANSYLNLLLTKNENTIYGDLVHYRMAEILILQNNKPAAIEKLTDLIRKYPKSIYNEESREIISRLRKSIN
jgi:tetratricopeptide (TPR) repeat protein